MTNVFIAGSRQITRLPAEVRSRVDTMIDKAFQVLVGDANGADKAVQSYLTEGTSSLRLIDDEELESISPAT